MALGAALAAAAALGACRAGGDERPLGGGGLEETPRGAVRNITFEEAAFIALGEPATFYGQAADPVPVRVTGERDLLDGERVWRIEMTVEFTRQDRRVGERWTFWVGTRRGLGTVLRSEGPRPGSGRGERPRPLGGPTGSAR
jgi:hypothetical protein